MFQSLFSSLSLSIYLYLRLSLRTSLHSANPSSLIPSACPSVCLRFLPSFPILKLTECPNIWEARCTLPTVGTLCIHRLEFCDGNVQCGDDELDCSKYLFQFGLRLPSEDFSPLLLVPADGYYYKQVFLNLIVMIFL